MTDKEKINYVCETFYKGCEGIAEKEFPVVDKATVNNISASHGDVLQAYIFKVVSHHQSALARYYYTFIKNNMKEINSKAELDFYAGEQLKAFQGNLLKMKKHIFYHFKEQYKDDELNGAIFNNLTKNLDESKTIFKDWYVKAETEREKVV